jgi:C4-type Zn-finger protein
MSFKCPACGQSKLRPAKFRFTDLPYLLFLLTPVRCRSCNQRFFLFVTKTEAIRRENRIHRLKQDAGRLAKR